ncbi:MAG TPA: hypothetical protein VEC08_01435 [Nitrososphaerales archaeon]|nr:hypothetical protein [Nitrososphaerales archaeon]
MARRKHCLKDVAREQKEMREYPRLRGMKSGDIFQRWEHEGEDLEHLTNVIVSKPKA